MGLLTGLAAVVSTGYMNSALPQAGNLCEMDAIAACYIGGVSLMNLGQHWQYVVKAVILLLAVFYDVYIRCKAGLG
jgi:putative multiple sugar transport system permease protein